MSTSTIDTETLENSVQTGVNQLLRGLGGALKTILFALLLLVICLVIKAILLKLLDRGLNRFSQVEKSLHTFIRPWPISCCGLLPSWWWRIPWHQRQLLLAW